MNQQTLLHARKTDLITFLDRYKGFHFRLVNGKYRCKEHPSLAVKSDRQAWYWHSQSMGGYGAIDFLMKVDDYGFRDAVAMLADAPLCAEAPITPANKQHTPFVLPPKGVSNRRAFAYLAQSRGLDKALIKELLRKQSIYEDSKGNVVFVGYDEQNKPRYATLRGTYTQKPFRMDCVGSDKRYSFCLSGRSDRLYIFESAIDSLSHATLENIFQGHAQAYQADHRLSLSGTSGIALAHYLVRYPNIHELVFCLDNDEAGRKRSIAMARSYADQGYYTRLELPIQKDYNDKLLQYRMKNGGNL